MDAKKQSWNAVLSEEFQFDFFFYVFVWYIDISWKYISWYLRTKTSRGLAVFYNLPSWFQSMHAYSIIAGRMKMCQKTHINIYCPQQELYASDRIAFYNAFLQKQEL